MFLLDLLDHGVFEGCVGQVDLVAVRVELVVVPGGVRKVVLVPLLVVVYLHFDYKKVKGLGLRMPPMGQIGRFKGCYTMYSKS